MSSLYGFEVVYDWIVRFVEVKWLHIPLNGLPGVNNRRVDIIGVADR